MMTEIIVQEQPIISIQDGKWMKPYDATGLVPHYSNAARCWNIHLCSFLSWIPRFLHAGTVHRLDWIRLGVHVSCCQGWWFGFERFKHIAGKTPQCAPLVLAHLMMFIVFFDFTSLFLNVLNPNHPSNPPSNRSSRRKPIRQIGRKLDCC